MGVGAAILAAGAATAVGSVASSAMSSSAAGKAAQLQANASRDAAGNQLAMFNQIRDDLNPFREAGTNSLPQLLRLMGLDEGGNPLSSPLLGQLSAPLPNSFSFANMQNTPGYQFTLDQGLKGAQNSFAAQGLGRSGAALKGAAGFASGLADSTWKDLFNANITGNNQELARRSQLGDVLKFIQNIVSGGQAAANQTGAFGTTAQTSANALGVGAANALASGTVGSANALGSGLQSLGGGAQSTALLYSLLGRGQPSTFAPASNAFTAPYSFESSISSGYGN